MPCAKEGMVLDDGDYEERSDGNEPGKIRSCSLVYRFLTQSVSDGNFSRYKIRHDT